MSKNFFKLYVDPLLHGLRKQALGAYIATIYIVLAVADDFLLLSKSADELQTMLNLKHIYSGKHRYRVHPTKTILVPRLRTTASRKAEQDRVIFVGEAEISTSDSTENLGLVRSTKEETVLKLRKKISLTRRTN